MKTTTILVAGATGFLGSEICRLLKTQNFEVRAMVRPGTNPAKKDPTHTNGRQYSRRRS